MLVGGVCAREVILALRAAEVVTFEQLAGQDDLRAFAVCFADHFGDARDVGADVVGERGLQRGDFHCRTVLGCCCVQQ